MSVAEIISIIGIVVVIIVHLCGTVWWMSRITANLDNLANSFEKLAKALSDLEKDHMSRDDIFREIGRIEAIANKAHSRIDTCQLTTKNKE